MVLLSSCCFPNPISIPVGVDFDVDVDVVDVIIVLDSILCSILPRVSGRTEPEEANVQRLKTGVVRCEGGLVDFWHCDECALRCHKYYTDDLC